MGWKNRYDLILYQLARGLAPLNDALSKGFILDNSKQILKCIKQINLLFPNLSELPDEIYPQEAYRLLTALGHYTSGDAEAAIHALLPAFTNQSFQDIAHKVLGFLFSSNAIKSKLQEMGMCLVPALNKLLKSKYPHAEKITTTAYCLWAAASQAPLMVSIAEPSDAPFVTKSLEPGPTIEDLVLPIKKELANIVPQELRIPEPLVENSSEIEPSLSSLSEIGEEFKNFELKVQRLDALERFRKCYEQRFANDRATCCFGFFYCSRLNLTTPSLNDIFDHALRNHGHRTGSVLDALGWLDAHGQIEASIRVLIDYEYEERERLNCVPLGN